MVCSKLTGDIPSPRPPAPGMEHLRQLLDRQTLADKALGRGKVARRKVWMAALSLVASSPFENHADPYDASENRYDQR